MKCARTSASLTFARLRIPEFPHIGVPTLPHISPFASLAMLGSRVKAVWGICGRWS